MRDNYLFSFRWQLWILHGSIVLSVFACLGVAVQSGAETTNISIVPCPSWVRLCDWTAPTNQSKAEKKEGSRYLVYECQENPKLKETFTRVVRLMENETGVQDSGSLRFSFDPSFEELLLNRVQIHREGKVLERLDRSKIRIIQPEPDLAASSELVLRRHGMRSACRGRDGDG